MTKTDYLSNVGAKQIELVGRVWCFKINGVEKTISDYVLSNVLLNSTNYKQDILDRLN